MAFNIREFFKGLLISEENTNSPKQIEITPGGNSNTKTSILSSQTANRAITLPDDTTTLLGTATVQNVSNKTITTSTVDSTPIGQTVPAAVSTTSLVATTADINGGTIDATVIGATTPAAAAVTSLVASTAAISGGSINNTTVGAVTPSTGSFTSLSANTATIGGVAATTASNTQTLTNKSLDDSTTRIVDTVDATKKLAFDVTGNINTTTTIRSSQTLDRTLDLPDATDTLVARNTTDTLTNKTLSTSVINSPTISGGSINNTTVGATAASSGAFTILTTTGNAIVGGSALITGDLTVNGTTVTLNTTNLSVTDKNITVNVGGSDLSSEGAGLTVDRIGVDGSLIYKDASATKFAVGPAGSEQDIVGTVATQTLTNKTLTSPTVNTPAISGGTIDNTVIGGTTPAAGTFTSMTSASATVGGAAVTTAANSQTFTNKNLDDTTTFIVDTADGTKRIGFNAGGTTGTTTTLTAAQTANRTWTLPDATSTAVGTDTTQTLTNKTIQFLQEAVATDAATTGTATTLAAFTTGIVRLTNASLVSLAGIPAGASGQNLTIENKTGATISILNEDLGATAANRIQTGTAATVSLSNNASLLFKYDTTSSRYQVIGGTGSGTGSGSGGVNFIPTGDAESTNPFVGYQYLSTTRPDTSGFPAVTGVAASITLTSPLAGNASFLITKTSGANAQGLAVDIPFTVSPAYRGKMNTIEFDSQLVSGTFQAGSPTQDSDLIPYIIDVDSNAVIEPSNFKILSNSTTNAYKFSAQFQTSAASVNYRLTFYTATTNTANYSLKVDNIKVGPSAYSMGAGPVEQILAYQTGTNTSSAGVDTLINLNTVVGSLGTYTLSSNAVQVRSSGKYKVRAKLEIGANTETVTIKVGVNGVKTSGRSHMVDANASGSNNHFDDTFYFDFVGGEVLNMYVLIANARTYRAAELEIIQLVSPSLQTSDQTSSAVVDFVGVVAVGTVLTANVTNIPLGTEKDSNGGWSSTTYTVQVPGDYLVAANLQLTASASTSIIAYVNGVATARVGTAYASSIVSGSVELLPNLRSGDTVTFRSQVSVTTLASTTEKIWIERISGPASILAVETTAISYSSTNGPAIGTGATAIAFNVRDYDTHGNQYTGSTFTALASGKFRVSARYLTTAVTLTTTQRIDIFIYKNGAMYSGQQQYGNGAAGISYTAQLMDTIQLNAGDTLQIYGQSSVATSVSTAAGYSRVCIERIGL